MIINGKSLLELKPIKDMLDHSEICNGLSYGLSESGYDIRCKEDVIIDPSKHNGRFYTASSIEYFQMPDNLLGEVSDKSTWARKGISVKNTKIKPGWRGYLTIEIVYELDDPTVIKAGSSLCQIIFHEMKESIGYKGIYQDQESGPQEGRLYKGEEKEEIISQDTPSEENSPVSSTISEEELDGERPLNSEGLPVKDSLEDFVLSLQDSEFAPEDYYKEINKVFGERASKLPLTLINIWNKASDKDVLSIVRKCVEAAKEFWLIDPVTPLEKIALHATELLASKAVVSSKEKTSYKDCLSFINRRYRSILATLKSSEAFLPVDEESASEDILEPSEDDSPIVNIELPVCTDVIVEDKEFERRINYPESILNLFPEDCNILFEEKMQIASEILKDLQYRLSLDLASGNKALMEFLNDKSSTTYIKFLLRFAKTIVDSRLFDSF